MKKNKNLLMCPKCGVKILIESSARECYKCGTNMNFIKREFREEEK